ncbi:hypothetical protein [Flindersiella endophytica]
MNCPVCGFQNSVGSAFCTNCGAYLEWSSTPANVPGPRLPTPEQARPPGYRQEGPLSQRQALSIAIATSTVPVDPGGQATVEVTIRNQGTIVEDVGIDVVGPAGAWAQIDNPRIQLYPDAEGMVQITFTPPRESFTASGPMPFQVRATSQVDTSVGAAESGVVVVSGFDVLSARIAPQIVRKKLRGTYQITVMNGGNQPVQARIVADDPEHALVATASPQALTVPPGSTAQARLVMKPRQLIWTGQEAQRPFTVEVQPYGAAPVPLNGSLVQLPIIPKWPIMLLVGAAAAAVALIAAFIIRPAVQQQNAANENPFTAQQQADQQQQQADQQQDDQQQPQETQTPDQNQDEGDQSDQGDQGDNNNGDQNQNTPPPGPKVRIQQEATIPQPGALNLDNGELVEAGADGSDVAFVGDNDENRVLEPANDALLANLGRVQPSFDACATAELKDDSISFADLAVGSVVCVKTSEDRASMFRVDELPSPTPGQLRITFATFERSN